MDGLSLRSHRPAGNGTVRCRGHLFTTIWVPGTSLKPINLGWWRFHHCRAGHHWTIVPLVEASGSIDGKSGARGRAQGHPGFLDRRMPSARESAARSADRPFTRRDGYLIRATEVRRCRVRLAECTVDHGHLTDAPVFQIARGPGGPLADAHLRGRRGPAAPQRWGVEDRPASRSARCRGDREDIFITAWRRSGRGKDGPSHSKASRQPAITPRA